MSVYDAQKPHVSNIFISYSSIDRARVNGLGLLLEAMGHKVFHDHRTIMPGRKWEAALQEGLEKADGMMVFWTKHALKSQWVRKEYEFFSSNKPDQPLVPVLGDETPLSEILATRQAADFSVLPNELLEMKRKMKKEGKGPKEIMAAVDGRLQKEGIRLKGKARMYFFLFLGFGWLASLLRYPGESAKTAGRAVVEKTAQAGVGQLAVLGLAAVLGFAAGWTGRAPEKKPPVEKPAVAERVDLTPLQREHAALEGRLDELRGFFPIDTPSLDLAALDRCRQDVRVLREEVLRLAPVVCSPSFATRVPPPSEAEKQLVEPRAVFTPRPAYPGPGALGVVTVNALIDEQGGVAVEGSSGPGELRPAAEQAVADWKFEPGTEDGRPVAWPLTVRVRFEPEPGTVGGGPRPD